MSPKLGAAVGTYNFCDRAEEKAEANRMEDLSHLSLPTTIDHAPPDDLVIKHAIVLVRHGDRTPISAKLGNFKLDATFWAATLPSSAAATELNDSFPIQGQKQPLDHASGVFGQLTARGAQQCQTLGGAMRSRFERSAPHLLVAPLTARSTNMRRTCATAQSFLAGFGAAIGTPVVTRAWSDENLVPNVTACRPLGVAMKRADAANAAANLAESAEIKSILAPAIGIKSAAGVPTSQAREVLLCLHAHNAPLPPGIYPDIVRAIAELDALEWSRRYSAHEVMRLGMGPLLHELREALGAVATSKRPGGIDLLAAHDTTLVALLCAMASSYDNRPVPYAAHLLIELAEDDLEGEWYVRMLFNWRPIPFENAEPNGWLAWRTFEAAVLANATDPAEHAKLTEEAAERQGEGNLAAGSTATDAWKDVLTGRGRL